MDTNKYIRHMKCGFGCLKSAAYCERKNDRHNADWWRSRASLWFRKAARTKV